MPAFFLNNEIVYMTGEILLQPKDGVDIKQITGMVNNEVQIIQRSKYNTFVLEVNRWEKLFEYANRIYESGLVKYCHPNFSYPFFKMQSPTDPLYPHQYYLNDYPQLTQCFLLYVLLLKLDLYETVIANNLSSGSNGILIRLNL